MEEMNVQEDLANILLNQRPKDIYHFMKSTKDDIEIRKLANFGLLYALALKKDPNSLFSSNAKRYLNSEETSFFDKISKNDLGIPFPTSNKSFSYSLEPFKSNNVNNNDVLLYRCAEKVKEYVYSQLASKKSPPPLAMLNNGRFMDSVSSMAFSLTEQAPVEDYIIKADKREKQDTLRDVACYIGDHSLVASIAHYTNNMDKIEDAEQWRSVSEYLKRVVEHGNTFGYIKYLMENGNLTLEEDKVGKKAILKLTDNNSFEVRPDYTVVSIGKNGRRDTQGLSSDLCLSVIGALKEQNNTDGFFEPIKDIIQIEKQSSSGTLLKIKSCLNGLGSPHKDGSQSKSSYSRINVNKSGNSVKDKDGYGSLFVTNVVIEKGKKPYYMFGSSLSTSQEALVKGLFTFDKSSTSKYLKNVYNELEVYRDKIFSKPEAKVSQKIDDKTLKDPSVTESAVKSKKNTKSSRLKR